MWTYLWTNFKPFLVNQALWTTIVTAAIHGLSLVLKLGLTDTVTSSAATFVASFLITHLFHINTVGKVNTNA